MEKDLIKKSPKKASFLKDYNKGEIDLFEDYLDKMISSKAAEIYKQSKIKKDDPAASEVSSYVDTEEREENEDDSSDVDGDNWKVKKKLKPSGVVFSTTVDPEEEEESEEIDEIGMMGTVAGALRGAISKKMSPEEMAAARAKKEEL
jgi:hypothetical protein